jgi:hypothetical protein
LAKPEAMVARAERGCNFVHYLQNHQEFTLRLLILLTKMLHDFVKASEKDHACKTNKRC